MVSRKYYFLEEKKFILTSLLILKDVLVPNDFFCPHNCLRKIFLQKCFLEFRKFLSLGQKFGCYFLSFAIVVSVKIVVFQTFKDRFCCENDKRMTLVHVFDPLLDGRVAKCYHFSLYYHEIVVSK